MSYFSSRQYVYCSVKYCCSNSSIPWVILHSIMKSIKTPNHPAYHWSTLWPLEVWVRGLYNSWWFCVHKLSMFIYLSMGFCAVPASWTGFCTVLASCIGFSTVPTSWKGFCTVPASCIGCCTVPTSWIGFCTVLASWIGFVPYQSAG